jgi:hypothetical protein
MSREQFNENAKTVFTRLRDRLFKAIGIGDEDWEELIVDDRGINSGLLIPGTGISSNNRDCEATYLVAINSKNLRMKILAKRTLTNTGAAGNPSIEVTVRGSLRWKPGEDFDAFASNVRAALNQMASEL